MIGAEAVSGVDGDRVASEKVWPPWKRTVSPGCRDARLTRAMVCQGADAEPELESEPEGLT